jgi:hypothetical protein
LVLPSAHPRKMVDLWTVAPRRPPCAEPEISNLELVVAGKQ